jgi:hypothetical protein
MAPTTICNFLRLRRGKLIVKTHFQIIIEIGTQNLLVPRLCTLGKDSNQVSMLCHSAPQQTLNPFHAAQVIIVQRNCFEGQEKHIGKVCSPNRLREAACNGTVRDNGEFTGYPSSPLSGHHTPTCPSALPSRIPSSVGET